jgi:hypothetical protein
MTTKKLCAALGIIILALGLFLPPPFIVCVERMENAERFYVALVLALPPGHEARIRAYREAEMFQLLAFSQDENWPAADRAGFFWQALLNRLARRQWWEWQ